VRSWLAADELQLSPRATKALLAKVAMALGTARAAINQLPHGIQRDLIPSRNHGPATSTLLLQDLIQAYEIRESSLAAFLNDLDFAAKRAELRSRRLIVPRSGGRPDYCKQSAADSALAQVATRSP
jgi:hypothetical protein